jgi:hypothetical protein
MPTCRRLPPLPPTHENAAASSIYVALGQRECLADTQTGAPAHDDERSGPQSVSRAAHDSHDSDDLLNGWRVRRIPKALVARRAAAVKAGHGRRRAATAGSVK